MDLVFYLRKHCLFYLFDLGLVFRTGLVLPLLGVLFYLLLHDEDGLSGSTTRIIFFELVLLGQFFLLLALALLFLLGLGQLEHHLLFFWSWRYFHFILFIEILDSIGYLREFVLFHKLTDPQPAISEHLFLQWLLPFIIQFFLEIAEGLFVLFLVVSLHLPHSFSVLVHFVERS